jgi:methyl-accepting chemotaxis protein
MQWFRNLNTIVKLMLGFSIVLTLTGVVGYVGIEKMALLDERVGITFDRDLTGISDLKEARIFQLKAARAIRNAVLDMGNGASVELEKQELEVALTGSHESLEKAAKTIVSEEGKAKVASAREAFLEYERLAREVIGRVAAGQEKAARVTLGQASPINKQIDSAIGDAIRLKTEVAAKGKQDSNTLYAEARYTMMSFILGAIVIGLGLGWYTANTISGPLRKAVTVLQEVAAGDLTRTLEIDSKDEIGRMAKALNEAIESIRETLVEVSASAASVTSASVQLAGASESMASGAQQQAASLEETSASLEQITATVRQNADNAKQANQVATGSRDSAEKGGAVVGSAVTAMAEINASSNKIADIISAIDEIAFQTNLLALNAAVEAARAGEQGRGFAVVAAEVRNLAQRSATAAKEIKALIQDSVRKVESGSELVTRSGSTLQEIVSSVKRVTDIVGEIAAASQEQTTGIEQVNAAMMQMDQVMQANSAQTEELSSTAQSLSGQAQQLQTLVERFTIDVKRHKQAASAPPVSSRATATKPRPRPASAQPARPVHATSNSASLAKLAGRVDGTNVTAEDLAASSFEEF